MILIAIKYLVLVIGEILAMGIPWEHFIYSFNKKINKLSIYVKKWSCNLFSYFIVYVKKKKRISKYLCVCTYKVLLKLLNTWLNGDFKSKPSRRGLDLSSSIIEIEVQGRREREKKREEKTKWNWRKETESDFHLSFVVRENKASSRAGRDLGLVSIPSLIPISNSWVGGWVAGGEVREGTRKTPLPIYRRNMNRYWNKVRNY